MNDLNSFDLELIERIKRKIEKTLSLGDPNNWIQKDYEYLIFFIEDKTGVRLSLSTIKRIWRGEYNRLPHISTLNALSQLAYQLDWLSLKKDHLENENTNSAPVNPVGQNVKQQKKSLILPLVVIALCAVFVFGLSFFTNKAEKEVLYDEEKIDFSCKKSADGNIPNTVVFNYNIESVKADRFFIQQSWDNSRLVEIFKDHTAQTDIYYLPGYFMAKLIADTKIIKEIPVHITYNDWFMAVRKPDNAVQVIDKKLWQHENHLGISKSALKDESLDLNNEFQLGFYNVREFGVDGDNFSYTSSFKMDTLKSIPCPDLSLMIKGEYGYFWIMYGNRGCESELNMQCSNLSYNGKKHDLTMFGTNIYDWQKIGVYARDKKVVFTLNGIKIFENEYSQPIGAIKDISYFFKGLGKVDDVVLKNIDDEVKFFDDFAHNN